VDYLVTALAEAPTDEVWRLFIDIERWPDMTRSMREVRRIDSGPLRVGSEAIIRQPRLPRARWRVTALEPGHSFTWETTAPGLTTAGDHVVAADGPRARITHTHRQSGPLAGAADAVYGRLSRKYLSMELEGYRLGAESARGRPRGA
jgi:uncharacterized membrane protein